MNCNGRLTAFFHSIYDVAYKEDKLISFIKSSRYVHIFFCSSDPTTNSETRNEKKITNFNRNETVLLQLNGQKNS